MTAFHHQRGTGEVNALSEDQTLRLRRALEATVARNNRVLDFVAQEADAGSLAVNAQSVGAYALNRYASEVLEPYFTWRIDHSVPLSQRLTPEYTFETSTPPEVRAAVQEYAENLRQQILANDRDLDLELGIYTPEEITGLYREVVSQLRGHLARTDLDPSLRGQIEFYFESFADESDPEAMQAFLGGLRAQLYYARVNSFTVGRATFEGLLCSSQTCLRGLGMAMPNASDIRDGLSEIRAANNAPGLVDEILASCQATFIEEEDLQRRSTELRAALPAIYDRFLERVLTGACESSRGAFREFLERVEVNLGNNLPFEDRLNAYEAALDRVPDRQDALREYLELSGGYRAPVNIRRTFTHCVPASTVQTSDSVVIPPRRLGGPTLNISDFSCSHQTTGEDIISHEIGHLLSYAHRLNLLGPECRSSYLRTRTCVAENSPALHTPQHDHGFDGDDNLTEEDMADRISFAYNRGSRAFCGLQSVFLRAGDFSYADEGEARNHPLSRDTHSRPLTRLLRGLIYAEEALPLSCQRFVESNLDAGFAICE